MSRTASRWLLVAAIAGAVSLVLGAFGAHGVPSYLESKKFDERAVAERVDDFNTAARYNTYGALFLLGVALAFDRVPGRSLSIAAWCMLVGIVVFSGAVYAVALVPDELRGTFGRLAPIGGTLMIVAWVALGVGAIKHSQHTAS